MNIKNETQTKKDISMTSAKEEIGYISEENDNLKESKKGEYDNRILMYWIFTNSKYQ